MRLGYRAHQFWLVLSARPSRGELGRVEAVLTPAQMALFNNMQPGEQAHALQMLEALQTQGETDADLLVAALLHDTGKQRCPLRLWERVVIVLVQAISPTLALRWGRPAAGGCVGWRRSFIAATQHAEWGARLALEAGASPLTAALIRHHHSVMVGGDRIEDILLRKLQDVDEKS